MSKCKILLDCLSNFVGQNISPDLGQNNGRRFSLPHESQRQFGTDRDWKGLFMDFLEIV